MTILNAPLFRVSGDGYFKMDTSMRYGWAAKNCVVDIPAGFETDFASVPVPFRNLISINGRHRLPAVLHDYLYSEAGEIKATHGYSPQDGDVERYEVLIVTYSREDADRAFYAAMRQERVNVAQAWVMLQAVRLFGGVHLKRTGGKAWRR